MKCFKHPAMDACGFCDECGKALCHECVAAFKPPLCPNCALARSSANTFGEARTIFIKSAICFAVAFVFFRLIAIVSNRSLPISSNVTLGIVCSGTPWGWAFLSKLFPVTIVGNSKFVFVYYLLKFFAAYFIGIFVMAWHLIKIAYLLYRGKNEKKLFQQIDNELSDPDN